MSIYNKAVMYDPSSITSDPTAYAALENIENPASDLDDWSRDKGTATIFTNSKSLVQLGNSRLKRIRLYRIKQEELITRTEKLINKSISRKTISEWEDYGLLERGSKEGKYKWYYGDAPHELHASWLLTKGNAELKKCTYKEAGIIRSKYIKARDIDNVEKWILPFIEPWEIPDPSNKKWAPKKFIYENVLNEIRTKLWLRYFVLSQRGLDPLDGSYIIHYLKKTDMSTGKVFYESNVTINN